MDRRTELAALFASVSRDLGAEEDGPLTFQRVAELAVEVVPGADWCALTIREPKGKVATVGSTDELASRCDELQYSLNEGPCLDAAFESGNVVISDMRSEPRWPQWAPSVAAWGVRSLLAIRLHTDDETLGAMNLYSGEPNSFDSDGFDIALIYSVHAAEALSKTKVVAGLTTALETRHLIGVAQGIIAARYDVSYETAFHVLRRISNQTNVKLRDVVREVVDRRTLPAATDSHLLAPPSPDQRSPKPPQSQQHAS